MNNSKPKGRKENIVVQEVDGEVLIYDLERNKAFCLNRTSALVWQACDGKRTITEVSHVLGKQLNSQVDEDLVWLALDQLKKENLVEGERYIPEKFGGMDRRDVIKKIALTTAGLLPVIASLIAPTAAHANSACMTALMGCACGIGTTINADGTCIPMGLGAMNCADSNCRCFDMGFGNDDCLP